MIFFRKSQKINVKKKENQFKFAGLTCSSFADGGISNQKGFQGILPGMIAQT